MKRFLACVMSIVLVAGLAPAPVFGAAMEAGASSRLAPAEGGAREWYVAPGGSDEEGVAGTIDHPFASISHAISKMEGGDTVLVRGGTYREEIADVPSGTEGHPSAIRAYGDEEVWLTGGDPVANWKRTEANPDIWVADMDWDMRDVTEYDAMGYLHDANLGTDSDNRYVAQGIRYDNIVFAGGSLAPEGRWPNAAVGEYLDRDRYAVTDSANTRELVDDALPANVDFTGGHAWIAAGNGYLSISASVTGHDRKAGKLGLKSDSSAGDYNYTYDPTKGDYYFITKCLATLDAEGEWYKDKDAGKLYLFTKGDPNKLGVEAQRRAHAVRIGYGEDDKGDVVYEDASYITVSGINVRLGSVAFSPQASHCTFEKAKVRSTDRKASAHTYGLSEGVRVDGTGNLLARCEIEQTYGAAVLLRGSRNRVVNNHIHDTNFEHGQTDAAVRAKGREHLVSHNTVHRCMRGAFGGEFEACEICYNDLYDCMRVSRDGGVVYFNWHDYENSEFHHNWLHDTRDFPDEHMQVGLYLDSFTSSLLVYRNVVYGIQKHAPGNDDASKQVNNNGRHLTYQFDPNSLNNVIVNNTFVNWRPLHLNFYPNQDLSGTVFVNNIFQSMSFIDGPTYYPWNWHYEWDRVAAQSVATKRDILNEMGALFDADHNIEGYFRDNTWPAIENPGWADPENDDYTLVEGASVIDKGREVAGITDGFAGAAPDLGAYEYGESWKPGCDLSRDVEDSYALGKEIPYRNMLANRGFEAQDPNRQANIDYTDYDKWDEAGSVQRIGRMSSWGHWGWVVKQGSACAVLDSDGASLTQHVSGLKPNATYRMGGYGFVAGSFVRPSDLTSAKATDGADAGADKLASLRNNSPMPLSGLGRLEFDGVDFGGGRDRIVLGLNGPKAGQVVSVALGSAGNVVASYEVAKAPSTSEAGWRWVTLDLGETYAGRHDVYIVLGGANSNLSFAGFVLDASTSSETLSITAGAPDAARAGAVRVSSWFKPFEGSYYAPHSGTVKTGPKGELDFTISKQGGDLVGYVDEVFLSELPDGENFGNATACSHVFEAASCDPDWEWGSVAERLEATLTMTCSACGERVAVKPPVTSEEDGGTELGSASFAVVGDVLESSGSSTFPYHTVSVAPSSHGTASASAAEARRGSTVKVTAQPDEGYALAALTYKTPTGRANKMLPAMSFTMPPNEVVVNATFDPVFFLRAIGSQTYTGRSVKPSATVLYGDEVLVEGEDYTLSYADNVEVGTAKVIATGRGDFAGSKASATFKIGRFSLSGAKVSLSRSAYVYDGKAKRPTVTVKRSSDASKVSAGYAVTYKNNVKAGTATVTVKGTGNCSGSKSVTFKIAKAANPMSVKGLTATVAYNKKRAVKLGASKVYRFAKAAVGKKGFVRAKGSSPWLAVNSKTGAITVKAKAPKKTHVVKVAVTAKGDANRKPASKTVTVKVRVKGAAK